MEKFDTEIAIKILTGNASSEEERLLNKWLGQSEANRAYFSEIEMVFEKSKYSDKYSRLNLEDAWHKIVRTANISENNKGRATRNSISLQSFLKYAAIFIMIFFMGGLTHYFISGEESAVVAETNTNYYSISAPMGSKTKVELPDGTSVWLNSGSELKYPGIFAEGKRDVYLEGEAFFDVKKDEDTPFLVRTKAVGIRVLGTKFNIKSYSEEGTVETTLVEGLINIGKIGASQNFLLKPKQQAVFIKKHGKINNSDSRLDEFVDVSPINRKEQFLIYENVDTDLSVAWKDNLLKFKTESFESLAVKIERWYGVDIEIENEFLKSKVFTGSFKGEGLEQVLDALQLTLNFDYEIEKNKVRIR